MLTAVGLRQNTVQEWSHVKETECLGENFQKQKNLVTSVSSKTPNCSWNVLSCLPGIADRSESTSDHSLQLTIVI